MSRSSLLFHRVVPAIALALLLANTVHAQTGYGVDGNGALFSFDLNSTTTVTPHGNLGFVPEGIDFRPGSSTLYAIDIGATTSQLYTVNINTGAPTPVGAGFSTTLAGSYDLSGNQKFGFDFNPTTLQGDGSMRIRLVATNTDNLRLHSALGTVAVSDTDLLIPPTSSPFVDAAAYINNIPNQATMTTTLYDMDSRNDSLYTQNPPNNGTLNLVGPFGVTIDANSGIHFDIYTTPGSVDNTIGGDFGYAVFKRNATASGAYLLYDVNLATGATTNGRIVGPAATPANFDGGFSILPIPEPATAALCAIALLGCATLRRRKFNPSPSGRG